MKISDLSDEQLLTIIDGQLPISIDEGDHWYGGSTTILFKDENNFYQIEWTSDERIGWSDDWLHDESEDQVDSQTLINYLRNRLFGSIESERSFKSNLSELLSNALDEGALIDENDDMEE